MAYFTYSFSSHFNYPVTVSTNNSYNSVSGVLTNPFLGQAINDNFYYLACSSVDNTTRIVTLENKGVTASAGNPATGYVLYNGIIETAGNFYSGSPFTLPGSGTANTFTCTTNPNQVTLGNTTKYAFRIAVGNSIVYAVNTYVPPTGALGTSNVRTITFGESSATPYTAIGSVITYLNSKLKYNNVDAYSPTMACQIQTPVAGFNRININALTGAATFNLFLNDSYFQSRATGYASISLPQATYTQASLVTALQTALNTGAVSLGYSASTFAVTAVGTVQLAITLNATRVNGGAYEFILAPDGTTPSVLTSTYLNLLPSGIPGSGGGYNGTVPPFGILNTSYSVAEAFDLSTVIQFGSSGSSLYSLNLTGQQSAISLMLFDQDVASTVGIFTSNNTSYTNGIGMGYTTSVIPINSASTLASFYHARYPYTLTYTTTPPVLNFGGNFNANNITVNNMTVLGTTTYAGTINYSGIQNFGTVVATGNLAVTGQSQAIGYFDGGTNLPSTTSGRINFNGTLYAGQITGDSIGIPLPTYIYNTPVSSAVPLGYALYFDNPGVTPISGNGTYSSNTITFQSTTNNVLYQKFDCFLSKPASGCQGQGIAYDFTIDYGMINQPFQISFLYVTTSTFVNGDISVFLYDKTNGSIVPISINAIASSNNTPSQFLATFLPSYSLNYRLIFHITSPNASGYNFQFNAVSVTPQSILGTNSTAISSWNSYTPYTIATFTVLSGSTTGGPFTLTWGGGATGSVSIAPNSLPASVASQIAASPPGNWYTASSDGINRVTLVGYGALALPTLSLAGSITLSAITQSYSPVNSVSGPYPYTLGLQLAGTTNSTTLVTMTSTLGLFVGMNVSGATILGSTTIASIITNTSITLSTPSSGSGSGILLTFTSANTEFVSQWRRVGSDMELLLNYVQGVPAVNAGVGNYLFPLPQGYTIDWSKLATSTSSNIYHPLGNGRVAVAGSTGCQLTGTTNSTITVTMPSTNGIAVGMAVSGTNIQTGTTVVSFIPNVSITLNLIALGAATSVLTFYAVNTNDIYRGVVCANPSIALNSLLFGYQVVTSTTEAYSTENYANALDTPLTLPSLEFHFYAKVPIAQWSSSTNLATDYQEYAYNSNSTSPANDDTASFSYGSNGVLTQAFSTTGTTPIRRYVQFQKQINNRDDFIVEFMNPAVSTSTWLSLTQLGIGYLNVGSVTAYGVSILPININTVSVNFYSQAQPGVAWSTYSTWYWRLRKRSQGNTAEQLPVLRAEYFANSITSIPSFPNPICFDTIMEDTNTCVTSPSTAWRFTAPIQGVYSIEVTAGRLAGTSYVAGDLWSIQLWKNAAYYTTISSYTFSSSITTTNPFVLCGNKTLRLKTGDFIYATMFYSGSNTGTAWATGTVNTPRISIERLGN